MITGGYDEDLSPEARNARPFVHLLPSAGTRATTACAHDAARGIAPSSSASTAAVLSRSGGAARRAVPRRVRLARARSRAKRLLQFASDKNEALERALLPAHVDGRARRTARRSPADRFRRTSSRSNVPVWDDAARGAWRLEVGGMVDRPLSALAGRSRERCRASGTSSITSASKAGRPWRRAPACGWPTSRKLRGVQPRRAVRRLPVVRRRLSRELGHRERDASADARRLRAGRPLPRTRRGARRRASTRPSSWDTRTRNT